MATSRITAVDPERLSEGALTPGIVRELAFELPGVTQMRARAEPGAASDWHHHGDRDVVGYVVRGRARLEFGPGGADATEIGRAGSSTFRRGSCTATSIPQTSCRSS